VSTPTLDADEIVREQSRWTARWHKATTRPRSGMPWSAIEQNHRMNFDLWHEEDMARRDDLGAGRVREAKRTIDRCNQARNDAIERIDGWLWERLGPLRADSPLHSETPGMIIDRLSILSLKLYHMKIEAARRSAPAAHREKCRACCEILRTQSADLRSCLERLLAELQAGTRHFKVYRQFKMYNDASLNPQLYAERRRGEVRPSPGSPTSVKPASSRL
jgi:Protein of unknown function (DUF4254)